LAQEGVSAGVTSLVSRRSVGELEERRLMPTEDVPDTKSKGG